MAKGLGNNYRLWVESATPGTFSEVKGNTDLSISRKGSTIDTSGKSDFPYGTQAGGLRSGSIAFACVPDLPDANGYTRLETLVNATVPTPFNIQIRKNGSSGVSGDAVFECSVYATDWNTEMGKDAALKGMCTFVFAEAPTIDTLAI